MFKKILIANRGEIACRIIKTAKKMNIQTVAVYSDADRSAEHVRMADEAVYLGPSPANESYLKSEFIIQACLDQKCEALHPGYGFLSENSNFADALEKAGIVFIGPSKSAIASMGDKIESKKIAKSAGVNTVPGYIGVIENKEKAIKIADDIGYPVMIKASAGGGGKGMRAVWKEEELQDAWESARQESKAAFGNDDMYMEKLIEEPRHIEIQILGDSKGNACHLSERDCSVQRRHQKLTEETPSPFMTDALRKKMGEAAVKAAEYIKYEGAGTVEFLVDRHRNFYFMEMNTRIQVEHPITEQVVDHDLIREQILVAAGVLISGKNYFPSLHSIECRINAEDPYNDFRPSPGRITTLHAPGGHGVRLDTHVYAGYSIPPNYDSMIAKLITTAQTREEAINKMKRALDEFVIEGIKTTIPFHRQLMDHPDYVSGNYTTAFMDTWKMNEPQEEE